MSGCGTNGSARRSGLAYRRAGTRRQRRIIYVLEAHAKLAPRFTPLFERHARSEIALAVTTVTIAEVLTGPLAAGEEALARRYRTTLETWHDRDFGRVRGLRILG